MGTLEIVLKRAWPWSSRFTPEAAPIGFSGFLARVGARTVSAHAFSPSEGRRPSKTSAMGRSATGWSGLRSGIHAPETVEHETRPSKFRLMRASLTDDRGAGTAPATDRVVGAAPLFQLDDENLSVGMERATRRCVRFLQGIGRRDVAQDGDLACRVQRLAQVLALLVDIGIDLVGQPIVALVLLKTDVVSGCTHPNRVSLKVHRGTPYPQMVPLLHHLDRLCMFVTEILHPPK